MKTGHPFQQGLEAACKAQMGAILKDHPEMADKLIPSFHPGCRRLTVCSASYVPLKKEIEAH